MALLQWDLPMEIQSPFGSIALNTDLGGGRKLLVNHRKSVARRQVRVVRDDLPNGDGWIMHDRFSTGYEMQVCVRFMDGEDPACDEALCEMRDELYGVLWSLLRPESDGGRLLWQSYCAPSRRMLDAARLFSISDPEEDAEEGATEVTFVLDSPLPYAISETQEVVNVNGLAQTVTNAGNVDFWPVIKLYTDGATIVNNTVGKEINIFSGCLGGGSYIEIDTFRNVLYVDGDQANAKPCLDCFLTDFFPLAPGDNDIDSTGSADFLVNAAFA
jgi:hypothetical protein